MPPPIHKKLSVNTINLIHLAALDQIVLEKLKNSWGALTELSENFSSIGSVIRNPSFGKEKKNNNEHINKM